MKHFLQMALLSLILTAQSCRSINYNAFVPPDEWTPKSWVNLHEDDPSLAGVSMNFEKDRVPGTFPYLVFYLFWDGSVRQLEHDRSGIVVSDFYWAEKVSEGSTMWAVVDYGKGSDPKFRTHQDPRIQVDRKSLQKLHRYE